MRALPKEGHKKESWGIEKGVGIKIRGVIHERESENRIGVLGELLRP